MHQQHEMNSVAKTSVSKRLRLSMLLGTVLALGSCQGDTTVLLRIEGSAPGGKFLKLRIVDNAGPQATTFSFPEDGNAFTLPGTIDFQVPSSQGRLGVFVWVESPTGVALAQARSVACFKVAANAKNTATLTLLPAAPAFSPNAVQDCKCNGELDMCDPNAVGSAGGAGAGSLGGTGGSGGIVGGGGSSPITGGTGGSATDGGMPIVDAAAMGGTGGVDAAVVKLDAAVVKLDAAIANALFSFDNASDWTSAEATITQDTAEKVQGTGAISFTTTTNKSVFINSRPFSTSETPGATTTLGISVHVEKAPDTQAALQILFNCPPIANGSYLGRVPFLGLNVGWNQIRFTLTKDAFDALKAQSNNCTFKLDHQGIGKFHYDNLVFL
jgi:hypothetical protein